MTHADAWHPRDERAEPHAASRIVPFLSFPLGGGAPAEVSEGWLYSPQERRIHGHRIHYGIDFAAPRRSPVVAAAGGWAAGSYELAFAGTFDGKRVGYGYGKFVLVWHPLPGLFTCYAHLEEIDPSIPFVAPRQAREKFGSPMLAMSPDDFVRHGLAVEPGQAIGAVGDSGCSWGYAETPDRRPDPEEFPSWDETHLHFELFSKPGRRGRKSARYDPYNRYLGREAYDGARGVSPCWWMLGADGRIARTS